LPRSRSRASSRPDTTAPVTGWRRFHIPWVALAITLIVLVTVPFAVDPIRDAATLGAVGEATLSTPAAYLAIAPLSDILDTLTLITVGQHVAILLTAIAIFVYLRMRRASHKSTTVRRETIAAVIFLASVFLVYVVATMAPRPMAQLATSDIDVVAADFHSHTKYSHDGRAGWTEEDVRGWYRGAGVDVAYITDHATFDGAERGIAGNPGLAGQGTMLLQGLEAFYKGEHVNILSAGRRYKGLTNATLKDVDEESLGLASILAATAPVLIETLPGDLNKVQAASTTNTGVSAIEIVDGSPRGLSQTRRERARIVKLADSLNLALVTGSDNHGWGRAAPGWTLLRIPGWRGMRTDSLSRRIEDILRIGRREATRAVERRVAAATNPVTLLLAAPLVTWRMFTTLGADERVLWLVWTWGLVFLWRGAKRFRVRPSVAA
jgi:predicted metal-dependent phosphoesterase TrpH